MKPACNKQEWAAQEGRQEDGKDLDSPAWPAESYKDNSKMPRCGAGGCHFPPVAVATNYPKPGGSRQWKSIFLEGLRSEVRSHYRWVEMEASTEPPTLCSVWEFLVLPDWCLHSSHLCHGGHAASLVFVCLISYPFL